MDSLSIEEIAILRDTASWTALAGLAAALAVLVNVVALVVLWFQLDANRKAIASSTISANAAASAAQVAVAEVRPWVQILEPASALIWPVREDGRRQLDVTLVMKNVGRLPAVDASISAAVSEKHDPEVLQRLMGMARHAQAGQVLFPNQVAERKWVLDVTPGTAPQLLCKAFYQLPGDEKWHITTELFQLVPDFSKPATPAGQDHMRIVRPPISGVKMRVT